MIRLTKGFKLFQPWANKVVEGKLDLLVRSTPTHIRERVAVIATKGIDGVWLNNSPFYEIEKFKDKIGAIGSVKISDCIEIQTSRVKNKLISMKGADYWDHYPKYLITKGIKSKKSYIWILKSAKEWREPKKVKGGIRWANIDLEDR